MCLKVALKRFPVCLNVCNEARILLGEYVAAVRAHATETMELVRLINLEDRDVALLNKATTKVETTHRAFELARKLEAENKERREIERTMLEEARELASDLVARNGDKVLVVSGQGWHPDPFSSISRKAGPAKRRPASTCSHAQRRCSRLSRCDAAA